MVKSNHINNNLKTNKMMTSKEARIETLNNEYEAKYEELNNIKIDLFDEYYFSIQHNKIEILNSSIDAHRNKINKLANELKNISVEIKHLSNQ